jgi:hypothetical protein
MTNSPTREEAMSTIAVFGATGYAGSAITAEARSRGHHVVAVARTTSALEPADDLTVVTGSAFDPAVVREATEDADVIVVALHAVGSDGEQLIDTTSTFLDAAAASGARLGYVGGAGSLLVAEGGPRLFDTDEFPDAFKAEATAHGAVLDRLRDTETDVDWFYVSPAAGYGSYNPGSRTGSYRTSDEVLLTDAEGNSDISGEDYAIAFVDEIETPAHHRARFGVAY